MATPAATAAAAKKPGDLDHAKLQEMAEPLTVRVVKMRGASPQPIELPPKEGYAISGPGYTREDVIQVERVVLELSGGGYYKGTATDAGGQTMSWTFGWPVAQYPEKISPVDAVAAIGGVPPGQARVGGLAGVLGFAPNGQPTQQFWNGQTSWPPPGYAQQVPPGYTQQPAMGFVPPGPTTASPNQHWGAPPQMQLYPDRTAIDRAAMLEQELQRERARSAEERHARELDAVKRQGDTKVDQLAAMVAKLAETINAPRGESPELIRMREQLAEEKAARQRAEERADQRAREEAAERRHQESMAMLQGQIAQIAQSVQVAQAAAAAAPRGPDPMIELMREQSRQSTETMRELGRMGQAQVDKLSSQMMNPLALAEVLQKAGRGADETFQGMSRSMLSMLDMHRNAAASIVEMSAGPAADHPAIAIVKNGVDAAKEVANRYMKAKEAEHNADAQVAAVRANAAAQAAVAQSNAQAHVVAAQVRMQGNGLGGVPAPEQVVAPPAAPGQPAQAAAAAPTEAPSAPPTAEPVAAEVVKAPKNGVTLKPTELEMFGGHDVVIDGVTRLRLGVKNGLEADKITEAIIQGIAGVRTMNLTNPAFMLYEGGHHEDFVEILLPNAPQALKDAVIVQLTALRKMEVAQDPGDRESEEEEEEEEEEGDDEGTKEDQVAAS